MRQDSEAQKPGKYATVSDYAAFVQVLAETLDVRPMRLCSYCIMPNHWHLVLWPRDDGDLGRFMQRLSIAHVRRWQEHRRAVGTGHLYQGRYKSFPVQSDEHYLTVCRYVERNPLRANLVERAEDWRWSSLWLQRNGDDEAKTILSDGPVDYPRNWLQCVNRAETAEELDALRQSATRGKPFGNAPWTRRAITRLGLESSIRPRGRPRKKKTK